MSTQTQVTWNATAYQSGTQTVNRAHAADRAWFYVLHLAADTEGEAGRYQVSNELCDWLNGGAEPWWMDFARRVDERTVRLPNGCDIQITGPMIDTAEPPSWGLWKEDESADAHIERGLLADCLITKIRPQ